MATLSVRAMSAFVGCTLRTAKTSSTRSMTTSTGTKKITKLPPPPARLRRLQEKFQMDNGIPVHLKGGVMDNILYTTTIVLGIFGMGLCLNNIYIMAFPRGTENSEQ